MNIISWFSERMSDAFAQHPDFFVYLLLSITLLIILIYDMYKMKTNQISRQVSARIGKNNKENKTIYGNLFEKLFSKQEEKIKTTLQRANVLFTPKEFMTFMTTGSIIGFVVGAVIYPLSSVWKLPFTFLPYGFAQDSLGRLLAGIAIGFAGSYFPYLWVKNLERKRKKALIAQIQDALLNIADALKAGHVIGDAIKIVGDEMLYPMGDEFKQTYKEMEASLPLPDALENLKNRVNIDDFTMAINAMEIQYEVGGELEPLLRKMVEVVMERQSTKQEVLKTIANAKMTGTILMIAPLGFLGLFIGMSRDQYVLMISSPMGWLLIGIAVISYLIGITIIYLIIRNVTKEI